MHPPPIVYIVLTMLSLACCFLVGYEMGTTEVSSWPHTAVLALLLSLTRYVIIDFEYPRLGLIRIDDFDNRLVQVRAAMGCCGLMSFGRKRPRRSEPIRGFPHVTDSPSESLAAMFEAR
jgi:hypothetical protein